MRFISGLSFEFEYSIKSNGIERKLINLKTNKLTHKHKINKMASVANKIAFFTTLAFGRDLTASNDPLDEPRLAFVDFIAFLDYMNNSISEM